MTTNYFSLKRALMITLVLALANTSQAQCPAITCPGNISVAKDPNTCGAIVNFVAPEGTNPCGATTFSYTGGMQTYNVPANVSSLTITAKGAQGGSGGGTGGSGAIITGTVAVTGGSTLKILVGGTGSNTGGGPGGGGGSFVTTNANSPLIVAGGGGGNLGSANGNQDASTSNNGLNGYSPAYPNLYGIGGTGGNGATNSPSGGPHAGNGGGLNTAGAVGQCGGPGQAFISGGAGGTGCSGYGGYGGGGSGGNNGSGGGGGYSGGGGSYHTPGNGGGGGSYNAGTNQSNTVGNTGNGSVVISGAAATTLIAGLPPGSLFPIGVTTETYQVTDALNNTATCSFTVTVTDNTVPAISCPANVNTCTNVVNNIAPTVTNGSCSNVTYTITGATIANGVNDASGTFFNTGVSTVKYRVSNPNGNFAECTFTVTVSAVVTPTITISANPGNVICAGTPVTYSATITNGGPTPAYQWKVNNVNVGNAATYTYTPLNTDVITCVLTSNATCANPVTVTSNSITMTVNPTVTPTISISANPGNNVCAGTAVTYTATTTNGGPSPAYQWKVNNVLVSTSALFTYTPANTDVITCVFNSSANCANPATVTSNSITMTVTPSVAPTITITANPGTSVCSGTPVTFTATITNGGPAPTYQWKVNNVNVGVAASYTYTPANNDVVTCVLTSTATCAVPATLTSNSITMTVSPNVSPTINIVASPASPVCAGTLVTFIATVTNGGPSPSYQWKKNNVSVGGNTATYITNTLNNNDVITCTLTSSANCASPLTVTSSSITMTVTSAVTPTISITASPATTVCPNTAITFTAAISNGGPSPVYQWKKNNVNVGGNQATYTAASIANNDVVTCTLTSNATCASPAVITSNTIVMTVLPNVTPAINIAVNTGNIICDGTLATFMATATNAGPAPVYQWKKNNVNVGANSSSYALNNLASGDVVTCVLTSNADCASPSTATSNSITMTVNPVVTPSVSIATSPGNIICAGTPVTFTATAANGGPTPAYQWTLNGNPAGTNSDTYSNNSLNDNDVVICTFTSNASCANPATVASNTIAMTVNAAVTPAVSVVSYPGDSVCFGAPAAFFATPVNGGNNPSYQWQKNGNPVGTNSDIYTDNALSNGDGIMCILTSTADCVSPATASSNTITIASGNSHVLGGVSGITVSNHNTISAAVDVRTTGCDLMASINPAGNNPVSGNTNVNVTLDLGVNMYNAEPYVQRHFDIEPDNNAATATANITLYAYQDEFNAYNTAAASLGLPLLPANGIDNGNVRITQFHGTGTLPGNYTGAYEYITPVVNWDAVNHWWSISFPVTGFSGFYIHTGDFPLQVKTIEKNVFSIVAFPNPVQDKVTIQVFGRRGNNSTIAITDLTGRIIMKVAMDNDKAVADISSLATGMYLVKYTDDNSAESIKITKQ